MRKAFVVGLVAILILSMFSYVSTVWGDSPEPEITVTKLASLGDTDRWIINIKNSTGHESIINVEGKMSEPTLVEIKTQPLGLVAVASGGNQIEHQDILLGLKYHWTYEFNILGYPINAFEFNLDIGFPVRIEMQYSSPMVKGGSYPVYATLTPLDWPNYDEFTCDFSVIGVDLFSARRSFTTPFGVSNSWSTEFGPYFFVYNLPIIAPFFWLDIGLTIKPSLFSNRIDALAKVFGDGNLEGGALNLNNEFVKMISWNTPGQTNQFNVLAGDYSSLDYASILLSQFNLYLDSMRINFDIALLAHDPTYLLTLAGGFPLFYMDFSDATGALVFGTHPDSPVSEIRVDVPVIKIGNIIPEVPLGTVLAAVSMLTAVIAYNIVPKLVKKSKSNKIKRC